jgi:DNA-directed RNA polymerase subunit E'/Rpb7
VPSDIKYPTDLGLLNLGRKILEKLIDKLYKPLKGKLEKKPRTGRKEARKNYLKVAKKKKVTNKERRKAIKQQLRYIERNLGYIEDLISQGSNLDLLTKKEGENLETIKKLSQQQKWMYENNKRSIENRIVSIQQPYIRPIVRGKAGKEVEFGAKISISYIDGYVFLDEISWENFNESTYLKEQVEKYQEYTGYYPESIHVDKIYRTRDNRKYCQEKGIRMSGPPLGRPKRNVSSEEKKQAREDEGIRNRIEGKFGEGKRKYGLDLIKTKLQETSENKIAIIILAMNLMTLIRRVLKEIFCLFWQKQLKLAIFDKFYFYIYKIAKRLAYTWSKYDIESCNTRLKLRLFQQTLII